VQGENKNEKWLAGRDKSSKKALHIAHLHLLFLFSRHASESFVHGIDGNPLTDLSKKVSSPSCHPSKSSANWRFLSRLQIPFKGPIHPPSTSFRFFPSNLLFFRRTLTWERSWEAFLPQSFHYLRTSSQIFSKLWIHQRLRICVFSVEKWGCRGGCMGRCWWRRKKEAYGDFSTWVRSSTNPV